MESGQFLDSVPAGVLLQGPGGDVLDCNEEAARILGTTREELMRRTLGDPAWDTIREDGTEFPVDDLPFSVTRRTGEPCLGVIMGTENWRQARRWIHANTNLVTLADSTRGVLSTFIDVTPRVKSRRLLRLLSDVKRVAMGAQNESECLHHVCEVLVETGAYALAWVGVESATDGGVDIVDAAGETDYLYEGMGSWWGSAESGIGPAGTTLRTGEAHAVSDLQNSAWFDPWRERAGEYKLGSAAAIPFSLGPRAAVLNVYERNLFAFDEVTVAGLGEVAREVEFGLEHVRAVSKIEEALLEMTRAVESRKETERALVESEQRFRLAFEGNTAPMLFLDLNDTIVAANDAFCNMIGRTREEVLAEHWPPFTHPEDIGISEEANRRLLAGEADQLRYTKRFLHRDGPIVVVEVSRYAARDESGAMLYSVLSARDVTEERELSAQLSHQALHDPLTGLANRVLFEDRLGQAQARTARGGGYGAVLLLDLDEFKGVNDAHGHMTGDQLLIGIARRFELVTRSSDTLSRFGGDEYLYLAEGLERPEEAEEVAKRLLEVLAEPFVFDGAHFEQHASIGITVFGEGGDETKEFIQNADMALYEAKRTGKGHYVVFTPNLHQQAVSRFALTQDLRQAARAGELAMHYQPIVNLTTLQVVGFEALMRWRHPERGWVPPTVFIPIAEESDLIIELSAFALEEATMTASSWSRAGLISPYVSINLSARQFGDPGLVSKVERVLAKSGLAANRLVLEVTESVTLYDIAETLHVMESLDKLGVGIALDDFGTGYSSLSYLVRLNPRILKIDRYFVSPTFESVNNETLLETVVSLGSRLHLTVVAEGIETRDQLYQLREMGCDLGQGFLFSPAVPAEEIPGILERGFLVET